VKIEDGLNQTANQDNKLEMNRDGLEITGYIAEGEYGWELTLATAVKDVQLLVHLLLLYLLS